MVGFCPAHLRPHLFLVLPFFPCNASPVSLQSPPCEAPQCCPCGGQPRPEAAPLQSEHGAEQRAGEAQDSHIWQHSSSGTGLPGWPDCGHQAAEGEALQDAMGPQTRRVVPWREARRLEGRNRALGRVEQGAGLVPDTRALRPGRPSLTLESGGSTGLWWCCWAVGGPAGR